MMTPAIRKVALTVHIATSVGWLGSIAAYIALNVPALTSKDAATVRGAYLMMESVTWFAILPLAVVSLLTGIAQALGTPWGLFRHYWVVISFVLTAFSTAVLVLHVRDIGYLADMAADPRTDLARLGGDLFHSVGGLLVLLAVMVLNIYKPRGRTRYGLRTQAHTQDARARQHAAARS